MRAGHLSRTYADARDFPQRLDDDRELKLDVLPDPMPRNPEKVRLDDHAVRLPRQFQAHALVDDAKVASKERQRLALISRGGCDVKQETRLPRICLLGEMKPERGVIQGLGGVFEKLSLSRRSHATPRIAHRIQ
jgi:hypothetical protein